MSSNNKASLVLQYAELLSVLRNRFEKNMSRHEGMEWDKVQVRLETNPEKLRSLNEMELTGGEPDVVKYNQSTGEYIFYDCSPESGSMPKVVG